MSRDELSFTELRTKEIVNEVDGRKLGRTCDLVFSPHTGCVLGIVAPYNKRSLFFKGQEIYIPFKNIIKIGPDVILIRLTPELSHSDMCINMGKRRDTPRYSDKSGCGCSQQHSAEPEEKQEPVVEQCDFRCEKCMLFDCEKRWKFSNQEPSYS